MFEFFFLAEKLFNVCNGLAITKRTKFIPTNDYYMNIVQFLILQYFSPIEYYYY